MLELTSVLVNDSGLNTDQKTDKSVVNLNRMLNERQEKIQKLRQEVGQLNKEMAKVRCSVEEGEVLKRVFHKNWSGENGIIIFSPDPMWRVVGVTAGLGAYSLRVDRIENGELDENYITTMDPFAHGHHLVAMGRWNADKECIDYHENPRLIAKPQLLEGDNG